MPERTEVVAAGAVVLRPGREVLVVHRPRYDDWSLPKGKLDPGEHPAAAAVREVAEETGVQVRLGPPLDDQHYPVGGGGKTVHWWVAWPVGDSDVDSYVVNEEVDAVAWLPFDAALARLTYERDRATVAEAMPLRKPTRALVVLRHARAEPRRRWTGRPDTERPLAAAGHDQAGRLVPLLAAYDVTRVVSSSSVRCVQTVAPYAEATGWKVEESDGLTQEQASVESVVETVDELVTGPDSAVLCTHRPVLPAVFDALGVAEVELEPAGVLVVHHRDGEVVATELPQRRWRPPAGHFM